MALKGSAEPGNQMGPAATSCRGHQWLAYYRSRPDLRTGEREVVVVPLVDGQPEWKRPTVVAAADRASAYPVNNASPALACDEKTGSLLVAWSSGSYDSGRPGGYQDKDIFLATVEETGRVAGRRRLTTPMDRLREITPALQALPEHLGGGYLLAFGGDEAGTGAYDLYLRWFDSGWALRDSMRVTTGGRISHPSMVVHGDQVLLLWLDHTSADVPLAAIRADRSLTRLGGLRHLAATAVPVQGFSPAAPIFGASMHANASGVQVVFVSLAAVSGPLQAGARQVYQARLELASDRNSRTRGASSP